MPPRGKSQTAPRHAVGVLFVHGMGGQHAGSTLHQFGDPLYEWLRRWAAGAGGATVTGATLTDVRLDRDDEAPANATINITSSKGGQSWLVAESHWANEFRPPKLGQLVTWLVTLAPWMTCEYMRAVWARELARNRTKPRTFFARAVKLPLLALVAVLGPVFGALGVVALLVLRLLAVLPIQQVRTVVDGIVRGLADSLGDVFTIVESPLDRAAILNRIRRDLAWVRSQDVGRVVVLAHSAGSALTYELLRTTPDPAADLYVTLGQAIWRMRWVENLRARRSTTRALAGLGALAVVASVAALIANALDVQWATSRSVATWVLVGLVGVLVSLGLTILVWLDVDDTLRPQIVADLNGKVGRWCDFAASSDPVPAGQLVRPGPAPGVRFLVALGAAATTAAGVSGLLTLSGDGFGSGAPVVVWIATVVLGTGLALVAKFRTPLAEGIAAVDDAEWFRSMLIRSHRTMVSDHVTYPRNVEGFVTPVVTEIAELAALPLTVSNATAARRLRRRRTATLALGRATYLPVAAFLYLSLAIKHSGAKHSRLYEVGESLRGAWEWLATGTVPNQVPQGKGWLSHGRVGMVATALGIAVGWIVLVGLWNTWDRIETSRFFAGDALADPAPTRQAVFEVARRGLPLVAAAASVFGARGGWRTVTYVAVGLALVAALLSSSIAWNRDSDLAEDPAV